MPVGGGSAQQVYRAIFTAEGQENAIAAFRDLANALKGASTEQKKATRSSSELGRSFRNILLRTVAIVGVLRTFSLIRQSIEGTIRTGLEFNATIETAELAIASLITATADLVDVNGNLISGVKALDAAYGLAEDQVQKLRIAGIQTAATTQELVDAFQQAVGAGIATGLTLDEIRTVTIRVAQAAGALGIPYRQLNEEIRSILGGIIDQNTRIAKSLGITNEQIRLAKEQNRLADFLLERFEAFGFAGERITRTFAGLRSNLKETVEILAGDITQPLFEALTSRGFPALGRIFDFDTAQIADEFKGLIDGLQDVFFFIGDLAGDSIEALLDGLASASVFMEENRDTISQIGQDVRRIVEATAELVAAIATLGPGTTIVTNTIELMGDALEAIVNNPVARFTAALLGIAATLGIIGAIFGTIGVTVAGVVAGLTLVAGFVDQIVTTPAERTRAQERRVVELRDERRELDRTTIANARLLQQYEFQVTRLAQLEQGTDAHTQALARLLGTERELANAGFADEIARANGNREEAVRLIEEQIKGEQARLAIQLQQLNAEARSVSARLGRLPPPGEQRALEQLAGTLAVAIDEALADLRELNRIFQEGGFELIAPEDPAKALEELRRRVKREMAAIEAELTDTESRLESAFERNEISIAEFFTTLTNAREEAFRGRIALQRELLAAEQAAGDLDRALAVEEKITDIETDRIVQRRKEANELREATIKLADELLKAEVQLLEGTGRAAEAAAKKIELEFRDLKARLRAEGDEEGIQLIDALIDVESVRAQFKEVEAIVQRSQERLRDALDRIQLQEQIGVLGSEEARRQTAAAYTELRREIEAVLPSLVRFSQESTDPEIRRAAEELVNLYAQVDLEIRGLTDDWLRFKKEFREAAEDSLADFLRDAVLEAESLGDALRRLSDIKSLLASLAAAIVEITARMIALRIVTAAFGGLSGGGIVEPAVVPGLAGGGSVSGPGGPREDRVLARLSAGEYVVQASSVKRFGVDFFERLNRGLVPLELRKFRTGGLVGTTGAETLGAGDGSMLRGELTLGLSDGLVVESMNTPAGERLMLKVINRNRRGIRHALGLS